MKFFNISLLLVIIAVACCVSSAWAQDEPAGAKRIALRRPIGKAVKASTTTTVAPAPTDENEYVDDNQESQYGEEGDYGAAAGGGAPSSTSTTSTEAPKKVGPVIRPFRSNDDFLNSLKRRQQNAKKHRAEKPTPKSKPAPVSDDSDESEESAPAQAAPVPSKGFKGNAALNRRKFTKPNQQEAAADDAAAEESEQQEKEDAKPKRPLAARLALRKRI